MKRSIREDIVIDFPVPRILKSQMDEAEELDRAGNIEYQCVAEIIDVLAKEAVVNGLLTHEQWDIICEKYPVTM